MDAPACETEEEAFEGLASLTGSARSLHVLAGQGQRAYYLPFSGWRPVTRPQRGEIIVAWLKNRALRRGKLSV